MGSDETTSVATFPPDTHFVPICPDCHYQLSGLPDGRCPECGLLFEHESLLRRHRALEASKAERRHRRKGQISRWALVCGAIGCFIGVTNGWLPLYSAWTFLIVFAGWVGALLYWTLRADKLWYLAAHRVLLFAPPLVIMMAITRAAPHRVWSVPILIGALLIVCYVALRESPLVSLTLLMLFLVLPMGVMGLGVLAHAAEVQQVGAGWTELDKPTPDGWKPMLAVEAEQVGKGMIIGATLLVVVAALFARRALVRLRRMGRETRNLRSMWREFV